MNRQLNESERNANMKAAEFNDSEYSEKKIMKDAALPSLGEERTLKSTGPRSDEVHVVHLKVVGLAGLAVQRSACRDISPAGTGPAAPHEVRAILAVMLDSLSFVTTGSSQPLSRSQGDDLVIRTVDHTGQTKETKVSETISTLQRHLAVWNSKRENQEAVFEARLLEGRATSVEVVVALKSDSDPANAYTLGTAMLPISREQVDQRSKIMLDLPVRPYKSTTSSPNIPAILPLQEKLGSSADLYQPSTSGGDEKKDDDLEPFDRAYFMDESGDAILRIELEFEEKEFNIEIDYVGEKKSETKKKTGAEQVPSISKNSSTTQHSAGQRGEASSTCGSSSGMKSSAKLLAFGGRKESSPSLQNGSSLKEASSTTTTPQRAARMFSWRAQKASPSRARSVGQGVKRVVNEPAKAVEDAASARVPKDSAPEEGDSVANLLSKIELSAEVHSTDLMRQKTDSDDLLATRTLISRGMSHPTETTGMFPCFDEIQTKDTFCSSLESVQPPVNTMEILQDIQKHDNMRGSNRELSTAQRHSQNDTIRSVVDESSLDSPARVEARRESELATRRKLFGDGLKYNGPDTFSPDHPKFKCLYELQDVATCGRFASADDESLGLSWADHDEASWQKVDQLSWAEQHNDYLCGLGRFHAHQVEMKSDEVTDVIEPMDVLKCVHPATAAERAALERSKARAMTRKMQENFSGSMDEGSVVIKSFSGTVSEVESFDEGVVLSGEDDSILNDLLSLSTRSKHTIQDKLHDLAEKESDKSGTVSNSIENNVSGAIIPAKSKNGLVGQDGKQVRGVQSDPVSQGVTTARLLPKSVGGQKPELDPKPANIANILKKSKITMRPKVATKKTGISTPISSEPPFSVNKVESKKPLASHSTQVRSLDIGHLPQKAEEKVISPPSRLESEILPEQAASSKQHSGEFPGPGKESDEPYGVPAVSDKKYSMPDPGIDDRISDANVSHQAPDVSKARVEEVRSSDSESARSFTSPLTRMAQAAMTSASESAAEWGALIRSQLSNTPADDLEKISDEMYQDAKTDGSKTQGSPKDVVEETSATNIHLSSILDIITCRDRMPSFHCGRPGFVQEPPEVLQEIPSVLQPVDAASVGELTATSHEMRVEIEKLKRQVTGRRETASSSSSLNLKKFLRMGKSSEAVRNVDMARSFSLQTKKGEDYFTEYEEIDILKRPITTGTSIAAQEAALAARRSMERGEPIPEQRRSPMKTLYSHDKARTEHDVNSDPNLNNPLPTIHSLTSNDSRGDRRAHEEVSVDNSSQAGYIAVGDGIYQKVIFLGPDRFEV